MLSRFLISKGMQIRNFNIMILCEYSILRWFNFNALILGGNKKVTHTKRSRKQKGHTTSALGLR